MFEVVHLFIYTDYLLLRSESRWSEHCAACSGTHSPFR
jgi:hypothetical protein